MGCFCPNQASRLPDYWRDESWQFRIVQLPGDSPTICHAIDQGVAFLRSGFETQNWPNRFYFNQFPRVSPGTPVVTGEASPGYYASMAAHRVSSLLPNVKLLFIRRDPVERAISHLFHNQSKAIQECSLDSLMRGHDAVLDFVKLPANEFDRQWSKMASGQLNLNRFLLLGCYDVFLRHWYSVFGRDRILELEFSDLTRNLQPTMNRVFGFLEMDSFQVPESHGKNSGSYDSGAPELARVRKKLRDFYEQVRLATLATRVRSNASTRKIA